MSRDIPFYELVICDSCGELGAFDMMGDFYCAECLAIMCALIDDEIIDEEE